MKLLWKVWYFIQLLLDEKLFTLIVGALATCIIGAYVPVIDFGIKYLVIVTVFLVGFLFGMRGF